MRNSWDSYWEKESNRSYWLKPDKAVVELIEKSDRSRIKNVLDLGCGTGRHTLLFAEAGFDVTAVDSSVEALSILQSQLLEKGVRVRIIRGDYSRDLFPEDSFDFILSYNVLYHGYRETLQDAVYLIHRWLKTDGLFFFTCPTRRDDKYGNGEQVAPNTYKPLNSVHPGDIHYFADEADILNLFNRFNDISKKVYEHYWDNEGVQRLSSYWQVLARK